MSETQVKNQSLAELALGVRTLATLDLGTPTLGGFWIIEFVNINYTGLLSGAVVGSSTLRTVSRLLQSGAVLGEFVQPVQTIEEKKSEAANLIVPFQFPQTPILYPSETLSVEVELKRMTGTGQYGLELGKVTMGYTIVTRDRFPKRVVL